MRSAKAPHRPDDRRERRPKQNGGGASARGEFKSDDNKSQDRQTAPKVNKPLETALSTDRREALKKLGVTGSTPRLPCLRCSKSKKPLPSADLILSDRYGMTAKLAAIWAIQAGGRVMSEDNKSQDGQTAPKSNEPVETTSSADRREPDESGND